MPFVRLFQSAEATLNFTIHYYVQSDRDQVEIIDDPQSSTTVFNNNTNTSQSSTTVCKNIVDQQDFIKNPRQKGSAHKKSADSCCCYEFVFKLSCVNRYIICSTLVLLLLCPFSFIAVSSHSNL
jgi:hypothetical protein